jgi:hypothetical protein
MKFPIDFEYAGMLQPHLHVKCVRIVVHAYFVVVIGVHVCIIGDDSSTSNSVLGGMGLLHSVDCEQGRTVAAREV